MQISAEMMALYPKDGLTDSMHPDKAQGNTLY